MYLTLLLVNGARERLVLAAGRCEWRAREVENASGLAAADCDLRPKFEKSEASDQLSDPSLSSQLTRNQQKLTPTSLSVASHPID
jgi:hypothetical protein